MAGGRPQEYDRIKIGNDFVKWAKDNPEALTVPMFCLSIGLHSGIFRNWSRESEEFRALFMQGKEYIGVNRLNSSRADTLDAGIYRAHVGNYDNDINEYMREEKTFESSLRKDEASMPHTNINLTVPHDLAIGSDIPTATLPDQCNKGSK